MREPIKGHRHPICTVIGQSEWLKSDKQDWRGSTCEICERKDRDYLYTTITAVVAGDDLHIRFRSFTKGHSTRFLTLHEFRRFTAQQVIEVYPDLGRHFNDIIHQVYYDAGLPLGYVVPILRSVN